MMSETAFLRAFIIVCLMVGVGMALFSVASFVSWLLYQRHARATLKEWQP